MIVRPLHRFHLLGAGVEIFPDRTYPATPADNLPDVDPGRIFVHERDDDPVGVLLEDGDYEIIQP